MVSIGPNTQSYNFTHMFNMPDLRSNSCISVNSKNFRKSKKSCQNSLTDILSTTKDFTKFYYMVKLARMETILDNIQADFTIFVPSDESIKELGDSLFVNMDSAVARHIVKSSMLDRKITSDLLENSPACIFLTKDPPNRLFISNISGKTYIDNDVSIIKKDIIACNGIIHVIDKLLWPEIV